MNKAEVNALINELSRAAEVYYQETSEPILTDDDFDTKQSLLFEVSDDFPELFIEGTKGYALLEGSVGLGSSPNSTEITHDTPMLSLGKAKKEEDLLKFLKKVSAAGGNCFKLQAKLDGLAFSATYKDGKLFQLATRGDGIHGENVSFLTKDPKVTIIGLPKNMEENVELRGELFLTDKQFAAVNKERIAATGEEFKNARNAAVGLMRKSEIGVDYPVEFTFGTYSILKDGEYVDSVKNDQLLTVDDLTATLVGNLKITSLKTHEVMNAIEKFGVLRENFPIPTDGVVIKPMKTAELYSKMGVGSHHPNSQIAWKYPAEQAISEILEITTTVGKSGRVTPSARITPVSIDGSIVSAASLHNFAIMNALDARVGSKIVVEKANEIIPQIVKVISNPSDSVQFPIPTNCQHCNAVLTTKDADWPPKLLICPNSNCPSRELFAIKVAIGKGYLDIDRMGTVTVEELYNTGVIKDIGDLYSLKLEDLEGSTYGYTQTGTPRKLGKTISTHILKKIEESKTRPLDRLIGSLAIDGLGRRTASTILKVFPTLEKLQEATVDDLVKIDGIGEITANSIVEGLAAKKPVIEKMIAAEVILNPEATDANRSNKLEGMSFSISGKVPPTFSNRNSFIEFVEANGGEFHSSPKASTTHMIGDSTSTSSKIKKAKDLGLTIISPEEFLKLI